MNLFYISVSDSTLGVALRVNRSDEFSLLPCSFKQSQSDQQTAPRYALFHCIQMLSILRLLGPATYEAQLEFIRSAFESMNEGPQRKIYSHRTCATDTRQVEHVINSVMDSIIAKNLCGAGM